MFVVQNFYKINFYDHGPKMHFHESCPQDKVYRKLVLHCKTFSTCKHNLYFVNTGIVIVTLPNDYVNYFCKSAPS